MEFCHGIKVSFMMFEKTQRQRSSKRHQLWSGKVEPYWVLLFRFLLENTVQFCQRRFPFPISAFHWVGTKKCTKKNKNGLNGTGITLKKWIRNAKKLLKFFRTSFLPQVNLSYRPAQPLTEKIWLKRSHFLIKWLYR